MTEGIKSPLKETRRQALILVGHAVCKQPPWLYKILTQSPLFRELIKLLKTETDVVILLTGLLAVIMMLPIIPMFVVSNVQDIFDVFGRLATWTNTTHNIPREHLLHLQVGLYSLFHRLYAMFPCNFLSYLRHNLSSQDKRTVFLHTIMPMLEKVKMHPHLVTATKEGELNPARWRSRDYHDIISECSKISLDGYESSLPEEMPSGFSNLGSNSGSIQERKVQNCSAELSLDDVLKIPTTLFSQAMSSSDLNSLVTYIDDFSNTAPPTPLSVNTGSSNVPLSHTGLTVRTNLPLPTETAMEATPENTPVKDRDRCHFKLPSYNTPAAIQLFGPKEEFLRHDRFDRPIPQTPPATPTNSSVPSSPLPVTSTLSRRDSIFDSTNFRRESLMLQRLQKVQLDQQQSTNIHADNVTSHTFGVSVSQLSQSVEGARKVAIVQPHTNVSDVVSTSAAITELVRSDSIHEIEKPTGTGGPLTPLPGHNSSASGPGLIDPDLSLITLDEEPGGLDECSTRTCVSGGLHMADHKSMVAFAKKVNRLRYHSHCIAGSDFQASLGPSPGTSPSSTTSSGFMHARSRFMKRSMSCPDIKKPAPEEKDGKTPKLPEVSEVSSGLEDKIDGDNDVEKEIAPKDPEHPYEHLFQKILPSVMSPLESRTLPSPHLLLDLCLMKAANLHPPKSKNEEINALKGHIELLHGQLLFERHRREAHAHRNRRLALKCRKTVTLEEQNNTMVSMLQPKKKL
ncbi:unnamed protein product [Orchesella dallaii]|uniref:Hamartin n=1 Tax=Orchesella dallaii TaxID=48710 RepID=A0ABP1QYQ0_9HEXA